jgi:hypothetical protein
VVSAPCSAARRLEPEAARQPREIQILDALLFIGEEFLQKSIHLNKPILFLCGCLFKTGIVFSFKTGRGFLIIRTT